MRETEEPVQFVTFYKAKSNILKLHTNVSN